MSARSLHGQSGYCLHDAAPADGHPLFGNPEAMLNPFAPQMGLNVVPVSGAIGDLDGDGDVDAVATYAWPTPTANPATQVSVLLNKGDGVFVADAIYDPGDYPSSAAIGDLNGDGLGDLAITNVLSGNVSVLLNAGAAQFPTRVAYTVGTQPRSVVMADLDGDSDVDLAVANGQANTVSVLLNAGNGTFTAASSYSVANIPDASVLFGSSGAFGGPYLAVGDLDGDGDADLALPVSSGVSILKNNGNGTFAPQTTFPSGGAVWAVAIGDVDGDGDRDLVTANYAVDTVSVLKNNGNGTFAAPLTFSVVPLDDGGVYEPANVTLGDLDGDGDLDLACGLTSSGGYVSVWKNQGNGTFGDVTMLSADGYPRVATMADLNSDAHLDLAAFALDSAAQKLCVLLNDGTGKLMADQINYDLFNPPVPWLWNDPYQIELVDLDGDDHTDIVVLNAGQPGITVASIAVLRNLGGGALSDPVYYPITGYFPTSLALGDLDGDGDMDVSVAGPANPSTVSPGYVGILLNNGGASLAGPTSYATGGSGTRFIALTDVNRDGDLDAVTTNGASNDLSLLVNDGHGSLGIPVVLALPLIGPGGVRTGDLDLDGNVDLVITKQGDVEGLVVMWGLGNSMFQAGPFYSIAPQVGQILLQDLNGDCYVDLVVSNRNTPTQPSTFVFLANDGSGTFGPPVTYWAPGTRGARILRSADTDRDGNPDVLVSTWGAVSVFLGNGDGTFRPGVSYGSGLDIQGIAAGDLDGDGMIDVATANRSSDTFSVLWNRGCAAHATLSPADLDADGDVDLQDYTALVPCLNGPGVCQGGGTCNPPGIGDTDLDGDGDVDLRDGALFLNAFAP